MIRNAPFFRILAAWSGLLWYSNLLSWGTSYPTFDPDRVQLLLGASPSAKMTPLYIDAKIIEKADALMNNIPNEVRRNRKAGRQTSYQIRSWQMGKSLNLPKRFSSAALHEIEVTTKRKNQKAAVESKISISSLFHDRKSDVLIVAAHGFGDSQEMLCPLLGCFKDYDIATFDFRGHGLDWPISGFFNRWGTDYQASSLGDFEHEEVAAVVQYYEQLKRKNHKKTYSKIVGVGFCFGASMIVKAQNLSEETLFDMLILDGVWPNFKNLCTRYCDNPRFIWYPQNGRRTADGKPTQQISRLWPFPIGFLGRWITSLFAQTFIFRQRFGGKINVCKHLKKISYTPILFWHGHRDLLITDNDFQIVWDSLNKNIRRHCLAVLTPEKHLMNLLNEQPIFTDIGYKFINGQPISNSSSLKIHNTFYTSSAA